MTERRADDAVRDVIRWLKAEYMLSKIGEEFSGIISGVTNFGIFVELSDVYIDGLVHVTALGNDYYHFDPVGHRLTGERTRKTYRLGDKLRVRVVRVDIDEAKIDFDLVANDGPRSSTKASTRRRVRRGKSTGKARSDQRKAKKHK
jgi:ribonuclease R